MPLDGTTPIVGASSFLQFQRDLSAYSSGLPFASRACHEGTYTFRHHPFPGQSRPVGRRTPPMARPTMFNNDRSPASNKHDCSSFPSQDIATIATRTSPSPASLACRTLLPISTLLPTRNPRHTAISLHCGLFFFLEGQPVAEEERGEGMEHDTKSGQRRRKQKLASYKRDETSETDVKLSDQVGLRVYSGRNEVIALRCSARTIKVFS